MSTVSSHSSSSLKNVSSKTAGPRLAKFENAWRYFWGCKPKALLNPVPVDLSITAIIPAYNEEACIANTISSIKAQTRGVDRIIVVDDCSSDTTGNIARAMGVDVLRTPVNKGTKARAQNYALMETRSVETDLFVTIDADTSLAPDAIAEAFRFFADPRTAFVCSFVIPARVETFWEHARLVDYLYGLPVMKSAQNHSGSIFVSSGCFSIFRTDVVRQLGGFDARTIAEDMDLTWKISKLPYNERLPHRGYYAPKAICYPVEPPTAAIYCKQMYRWQCGLMQNVRVRGFNLFRTLSRGLAVRTYLYLLMGIGGPIGVAIGAFELSRHFSWEAAGSIVAALAIAVWAPVLMQAKELGLFRKALIGLPIYFVVQYVNMCIFIYAMYKDWIRRDTLVVWDKGH
ncbi:MAG: glycosyltransferase family 2 protein [Verrucomicrobia bacterium]|nr:glycosyltransferase family 2 protein [Verrucomicrobiota bacterium]